MDNKQIKRRFMISAVLYASTILGLGGCTEASFLSPPVCGGVTDQTDLNAPKTIVSKNISSFHAHFFLPGEWSQGRSDRFYTFDIGNDENGVLIASSSEPAISLPADKALLVKLQSIIDAHNLAAINGIHRITAGLPPAYQPCHFKASYASGELLQFTQNSNPEADWAKQTYLAFANWFAEKGVPALLPPQQHFAPVSDFFLKYTDNRRSFTYSPMRVQEKDAISGEQLLLSKAVYDIDAKKSLSREFILFPADYKDSIHAILSAHDLRPFDRQSVLYGLDRPRQETKLSLADLQIHVSFADWHTLYIDTSTDSDIEKLRPLVSELSAYHDSLFDASLY